MRRLQFDNTVQFVGRSSILAHLALGQVREAAAVYREFEHVLTDESDALWSEPVTSALGKHLPDLIPELERSPLSLRRIASRMRTASLTPEAPLAVYRACVKELRQQKDVEDRDAPFETGKPSKQDDDSKSSGCGVIFWIAFGIYAISKLVRLLAE
jgi:hypothetical protein